MGAYDGFVEVDPVYVYTHCEPGGGEVKYRVIFPSVPIFTEFSLFFTAVPASHSIPGIVFNQPWMEVGLAPSAFPLSITGPSLPTKALSQGHYLADA